MKPYNPTSHPKGIAIMLERISFVISFVSALVLLALQASGNLGTGSLALLLVLILSCSGILFASKLSKSRQLRRATGKNFQLQHQLDCERITRKS
jgi:hypothetical protein